MYEYTFLLVTKKGMSFTSFPMAVFPPLHQASCCAGANENHNYPD